CDIIFQGISKHLNKQHRSVVFPDFLKDLRRSCNALSISELLALCSRIKCLDKASDLRLLTGTCHENTSLDLLCRCNLTVMLRSLFITGCIPVSAFHCRMEPRAELREALLLQESHSQQRDIVFP